MLATSTRRVNKVDDDRCNVEKNNEKLNPIIATTITKKMRQQILSTVFLTINLSSAVLFVVFVVLDAAADGKVLCTIASIASTCCALACRCWVDGLRSAAFVCSWIGIVGPIVIIALCLVDSWSGWAMIYVATGILVAAPPWIGRKFQWILNGRMG